MNPQQLRQLLDAVASGDLSPDQALSELAELPYADLGFAKLDLHRELRNGLPEAVYAEGKTTEDLKAVIGAAQAFEGPGILVPLRNSALFAWCLQNRLRVVFLMTLMSVGLYTEPAGAYLPSVLY